MNNDNRIKLLTFAIFTINAAVIALFPLYFDYKGYTKLQIGLLYSVGPFIGIVSNLFWGAVSDRFQTSKKVMIAVFLGQAVFAYFMFQSGALSALLLMTACFYFFQNPMIALNDSQVLLAASRSGKSYPAFRVWGSVGFASAALAFGWVTMIHGPGVTSYLALGSIFFALLVSFTVQDVRTGVKKMEFGGLAKVIGTRQFLLFLLCILVVSIAHRMNDGFSALYLRQLGASDTLIGWSWAICALSEIPVFFLLSKYGHRYKELPLLAVSSFVYTVRFLLIGLTDNPALVLLFQLLHSLSFGIFLITAIRYIGQSVPDQYRASGQAVFAVVWSGFAGLISGVAGGWIFDVWGPHAVYLTASGLGFLSMSGFLFTHAAFKNSSFSNQLNSSA